MRTVHPRFLAPVSLLVTLAAGCGVVLGVGDFEDAPGSGSTSGGGQGEGGSATTTATTTGTSTSTTSSGGGDGGTGGQGGGLFCEPGDKIGCYEGPPGTEGKGACVGGQRTCLSDGSAFGDCIGDVQPTAVDDCINNVDTTCDEMLACACAPGSTLDCYDGPPGTELNLPCMRGSSTCKADGSGYDACVGQTLPVAADDCTTPSVDENCDGVQNDLCTCAPGATQSCYSGPAGSVGVGQCKAGQQTCNGTGTAWSACVGEVVPAAEVCATAGDEDCSGTPCSDALWSRIFTSATHKEDYPIPQSVDIDVNGNVIVAGTTVSGGPFDVGGGLTATWSWIVKMDATGATQWMKELGPNVETNNLFVTTDFGTVYVAGSFNGAIDVDGTTLTSVGGADIFVAAWNAAGGKLWAVSGGSSVNVNDLRVNAISMSNNTLLVGGQLQGSASINGGATLTAASGIDAFVVELNQLNGAHLWSKAFGDATGQSGNTQEITALASDAAGSALVAGQFTTSVQVGSGATNTHLTAGGLDMFVAKLDGTNGTTTWSRRFGGVSSDVLNGIAGDSSGAAVITGTMYGALDFGGGLLPFGGGGDAFAVKLSAAGAHVWSKSFGGLNGEQGQGVAIDSTDHVLLSGTYGMAGIDFGGGLITGMTSASTYLAKLTSAGTHVWSKGFSGNPGQFDAYVATRPSMNHVAFTFTNQGTVDLGNGPLVATGTNDSIVVGVFHP